MNGKNKKKKPKLDLNEIQKKLKSGEMEVKCAPQDKLITVEDIAYDFVDNVLGFEGAFITDLSYIGDFDPDGVEKEMIVVKVRERYGVDITEVLSEPIVDIAKFIDDAKV